MSLLDVKNVSKKYQDKVVVNDLSFQVPRGSRFGLLGPNGAGKTSLLRMITRITLPDEGVIHFNGKPSNENVIHDIGYLPEERGLYKKMKVGEQLIYLAKLKGMTKSEIKDKAKPWVKKFGIQDWLDKRVQELSKGMQQKVQLVSTLLHDPQLLILDEPFSGLDPVNTELLKNEILKLGENGTTILFSTHRMEQVEEICDEIVLINHGTKVVDGEISALKEEYKDGVYQCIGSLPANLKIDGADVDYLSDSEVKISHASHSANQLIQQLITQGVEIKNFNEVLPSLNQIFIKLVNQ